MKIETLDEFRYRKLKFDEALVLRYSLNLGLAVLALATVASVKTGASAQTANVSNPNT